MVSKKEYAEWIMEAIDSHNGSATVLDVSKYIWDHYQKALEADEEDFYKWQYKMRWAAMTLRKEGKIKPAESSRKGVWVAKRSRPI